MDREFIEQLKDYFSASELVELFEDDITVESVVYAFDDVIAENEDMLRDYMLHGD